MFKTTPLPPYCRAPLMVGLMLAAVSCGPRCGSSDSVALLDVQNGNYLVYRVSGAQDKMEFFELYRRKPEFDSCGSTQTPVIATVPYQRSQGLLKKVELREDRLEIVYTSNVSESVEPTKVHLSQ